MALAKTRSHKHFQLDAKKLKRAQRALRAETETETIERALDVVITEHVRNRLTVEANDRFVKSGVDIRDTYGALGERARFPATWRVPSVSMESPRF